MDGAGAPNEKGTAAPPNPVGIGAGGNAIFEASPDVYPVSMVEVGESIPKLAPPGAIGLLGNDDVGVGVEADAEPNIKGAGALDPPKENAGAVSAAEGTGAAAEAALPNEKAGIVNPEAAGAGAAVSGFEAGAPNMKGAGVAFAMGVAAGAPKVKGALTLAGAGLLIAGTGSGAATGAPNDIDGMVVVEVVVGGGSPKPKLGVAVDAATAGAAVRAEGNLPNDKPSGFLVSLPAGWLPKVPAPDEEGAVTVPEAAGNNIGAVVGATAGMLKPVKVVAADGITIAAAGARGAPKVNGAGLATGEGFAALVLKPDVEKGSGTAAATGAPGAPVPKVKGLEEKEGVGAAKAGLGVDTGPSDVGPRLFSHERHFTDPFGFWTKQVSHLIRSDEAAKVQSDGLAGSVATTAIGTASADTGTGIAVGIEVLLGILTDAGVGASAGAALSPGPVMIFERESPEEEEVLVFGVLLAVALALFQRDSP